MNSGSRGGTAWSGRLFVFAGIDGSGKTTQSKRLAHALKRDGIDVLWTREPGATALGLAMRRLLLEDPVERSPEAELMMFMADRAEHVARILAPALAAGRTVVCDRYIESTLAYQARSLPCGVDQGMRRIQAIHETMGWPEADLTIHMRIDPQTAWERIVGRGGSTERDPPYERLEMLRDDYDSILKGQAGVARIDASEPEDAVAEAVLRAVRKRVGIQ